ncbi:aldo/keto reductase [Flavihumibacter stibioxidans]|uniref:Aldo/keto reductase n=1 Tax=Flavihumibacter stibioxidans TaxID=1834163 RepID=A0ABR7MAV6_9BACT|nr:aldo/keto reductase [Flavihumibacter stibioxidans]MBC6492092.1 aldo/keto reductase [Flavihumibacter stibioxidans]
MKIKALGSQGLMASELGLGCMGMSEFYGERDDQHSLATLQRAYELGVTFWDTADMYGPYLNEELLSKALKGIRQHITLATKFGITRGGEQATTRGTNGKPEYVFQSCEGSLKRLQVDTIDLYYLHRVDPDTPVEETIGAMAQLVKQGKIRGIGLSEASIETVKRAHAVHPVSAVQTEYSLWSRDPESGMLETCKELGIAFVAYSPLGRGFLTGQIKRFEDLAENDWRRSAPRFMGENFEKNLALVEKVKHIAAEKNCTPAQLALAWVMAKGEHIFPIPGTKRISYLEENLGALNVRLTAEDLGIIDSVITPEMVAGTRYTEAGMKSVNR